MGCLAISWVDAAPVKPFGGRCSSQRKVRFCFRLERERAPNHLQDGLVQDTSAGKSYLLPHLRPSIHLCYAAKC